MARTYPNTTTAEIARNFAAATARLHALERALIRVLVIADYRIDWANADMRRAVEAGWELADPNHEVRTREERRSNRITPANTQEPRT